MGLFLLVRHGLRGAVAVTFFVGTAVLFLRFLFRVPAGQTLWLLSLFAGAVLWAAIRARRQVPTAFQAYAAMDGLNDCGGLFMSSQEVSLGTWEDRIKKLNTPTVSLKIQQPTLLLMAGVAYLVACLLIPQSFAIRPRSLPLDISRETGVLEKQIEVLAQETVITEERALELEKTVEKVEQTATGDDPVRTWEALDHLRQGIRKEADEFAAFALSQTEALAENEAMASALSEGAAELDSELLASAMEHLASNLMENEAISEALANLAPELLEKLQEGSLTAEDLAKLAQALKLNKEQLARAMGRLSEMRLVDLKDLKLCEGLGQCDMAGLAAYLSENCQGSMTVEGAIAAFGRPGRGGITRGRSDAPMGFTEASTPDGTAFKEQVLPPSDLAALKDSQQVGVSIGAPSTEAARDAHGPGVIDPSAAGSGEAATQTLLPKHRQAVKQYFERE